MKNIIQHQQPLFQENSSELNADKANIRQKIRELKKMMNEPQKHQEANAVFTKIELLPEFIASKTILLYWSTPDELPTHEIVEKWSYEKQVVLPTVVGDNLALKSYVAGGAMTQGALGIWEPDSSENYTGNIDLVIVPGVAFDAKRNRLGRGRGFYDRFFKTNNSMKIGIGFDFQLLSEIPTSKFDIQMDKIVTPFKTIE
ncbi:MAG: 5-formyltetrahydrofolate cyclo-ligase [Paludibacter sp.]|nr:5-formyltetrahydrofolate cyclo-ligase [Paludibacter sp.]